MYGKIFESIYHGSLHGDWETMVVFQQFIVLADSEGVVDMTPSAIASVTSMPIEMIEAGIGRLMEEDPMSRSVTADGRRIVLLDDHRNWGWQIVNHKKYRDTKDVEDKRRKDAERQRKSRLNRAVTPCHTLSQEVAHTDTDTDTDTDADTDTSKSNAPASKSDADAFLTFWDVVHLKVGKEAAKTAFRKAIKRQIAEKKSLGAVLKPEHAAEWIHRQMSRFASSPAATPTDHSPIHPATWLNQGRYDDDPETWQTNTNGSGGGRL